MPGISSFIRPAAKVAQTGRRVMPTGFSAQRSWPPDDDDDDALVVSESLLAQGKLENEMQRGMSLASSPENAQLGIASPGWQPSNNGEAMGAVGAELSNPAVQKDPAWWQKALGWLEPLKYMDMPIELAAQAVFDPIAMVTGRDLSWVRGTADREPFEGWDALFTSDDVSSETGFGEVLARMDIIADGFEKRPLMAQLGLGAVQIAATFGASGYAKAAQVAGKSMYKAHALRTAAMVLDPWEVGFHGIKYSYKGAKNIIMPASGVTDEGVSVSLLANDLAMNPHKLFELHVLRNEQGKPLSLGRGLAGRKVSMALGGLEAPTVGGGSGVRPDFGSKAVPVPHNVEIPIDIDEWQRSFVNEDFTRLITPEQIEIRAEYLWDTENAPRYSLGNLDSHIGNILDGSGPIAPDVHFKGPNGENELPWVLKQGNQVRDFIKNRYKTVKEGKGSAASVEMARQMTTIQMAVSIAARKNHAFKASKRKLFGKTLTKGDSRLADRSFLGTGYLDFTELTKKDARSALLSPLDQGEARVAVSLYKDSLELWAKENKDIILKATGKSEDSVDWVRDPLFWIKDEDQVLTFNVNAATTGKPIKEWFGYGKNVEKDAAYGDISFDGDELVNTKNQNVEAILEAARKETDPATGELLFDLLPEDSRLLRNIRTTELMHENYSIADIAYQLHHKNEKVTPMYLRSIPFIGKGAGYTSPWMHRAEVLNRVNAEVVQANEYVQKRIEDIYQSTKDTSPLASAREGPRAKGAEYGGADDSRMSIAVGEAFIEDEAGRKELLPFIEGVWQEHHAKMSQGKVYNNLSPEARILELAKKAMAIRASIRYAAEIEKGREYAKAIKNGIYKDAFARKEGGKGIGYRNAVLKSGSTDGKALWNSQPGLLNRAGYYIQDGKPVWAGNDILKGASKQAENVKANKLWLARREKLRKEMSLPEEIYGLNAEGVERKWMEWARDNYNQIESANTIMNAGKIYRTPTGKQVTRYSVEEGLREYADIVGWQVAYEYAEMGQGSMAAKLNLGFDNLFANLLNETHSTAGKAVEKAGGHGPKGKWSAYYGEIRRLNNLSKENQIIDGQWRAYKEGTYMRITEQAQENMHLDRMPLDMLSSWLRHQDIVTAFRVTNIRATDDFLTLETKLQRLAKNAPRLFGDGFKDVAFDAAGEKWTETGSKWINILAKRISNHKELWSAIEEYDMMVNIPSEIERIAAMSPIRARTPGMAGHTDSFGNEIGSIVGNTPAISSIVPRIDTMMGAMGRGFNEWINKDALMNRVLKNTVVAPLTSVFAGGMAGIARPLTRGISARAHVYPIINRKSADGARAYHQHGLRALGLTYDELTPTQAALSGDRAKTGIEFFNKLEVHDGVERFGTTDKGRVRLLTKEEGEGIAGHDIEDMLRWEDTDVAKVSNFRYMPKPGSGTSHNGGVVYRLRRMLNLGEYATNMGDVVKYSDDTIAQYGDEFKRTNAVRKYLTQVDMPLERIDPEYYHVYYKGMVDEHGNKTQLWKDVVFLRDGIWNMDDKLRNAEIDIPGMMDDRAADYLERYFPRIYYSVAGQAADDSSGVLTNGAARHFKERQYEDIVDIIGMSLGTHSHMSGEYMLRPMAERAGLYFDSMHKLIVDDQTINWLKAQDIVKVAADFRDSSDAERNGLSALESLLNGKLAQDAEGLRMVEPNPDDIKRLAATLDAIDPKARNGLDVESFLNPIGPMVDADANGIRGMLANATEDKLRPYFRAIQDRRDALDLATGKRLGEATAFQDIDWLGNTLDNVPIAEQRAVRQYLEITSNWLQAPLEILGKGLKRPTNLIRYLKSGLDMGAPMIHGYNSLVRLPFGSKGMDFVSQKAWTKATKQMATMWWDPDRYDQFIVENLAVMNEAGDYVRYATPEPLMGADDKALAAVRQWATKKLPKHKQAKFLARFESGFSGYLDVLRTELWSAMKVSVDNELDDMAEAAAAAGNRFDIDIIRNERYHDLGATINKMTGAFDPHLSQQTPFQSLVENSLFFFAPMYRRATFGIIADIFRPRGGKTSIRREQALRQLSGVVAVGAGVAMLAEMTGNNPRGFLSDTEGELGRGEGELDITSRFGKWNTHGIQVGIGTAWWTAFRAASDIAMHYARDERPVDESKHWSDHWAMELIGRRGRSQMAPGAALFTDVITGRNFIGEPLRDKDENNYSAILTHMGRSALPFWLDGLFTGNSWQGVGVSGTAEFLGLQAYEVSSYDKLSRARQGAVISTKIPEVAEWRESRLYSGENVNFISMPKTLQKLLDENETNVSLLLKDHEEKYGETVAGDARELRAYMEEKSQADLLNAQKLATISRMVETGQADYRTLQQALTAVSHNRWVNSKTLMLKYPAMERYFTDLRTSRSMSDAYFQGDIIYDLWQSVRHNEEFIDNEGNLRHELLAQQEEAFWMDPQAAQFREYAEARANAWYQELPTVRRFEEAKDYIRASGYWDIEDRLWKPGTRTNRLAKKFFLTPADLRDTAKERTPEFKEIERRVTAERRELARRNPLLDEYLVTFFGNTAQHRSNLHLEELLYERAERGLPVTSKHTDFSISPTGRITSKQLTGG